jgi:hypothetical protein
MGKESDMTTNDAVRPVAWRGLWDSQWVNIVNHNECYRGWELEDAVNHAVKLTEKTLKENNASSIAHLQARVEALTGEVEQWKLAAELNDKAYMEQRRRKEAADRRVATAIALARSWQDEAAGSWGEQREHATMQICHDQIVEILTQPEADHD